MTRRYTRLRYADSHCKRIRNAVREKLRVGHKRENWRAGAGVWIMRREYRTHQTTAA